MDLLKNWRFLLDFIGYLLEIIGNIGKLKVFLTFPLAALEYVMNP